MITAAQALALTTLLTASLALAQTSTSRNGQVIFAQTCITCHGPDGKGQLPGVPDLTAPGGPPTKPDDVLAKHIWEGYQAPGAPLAMPPKGGDPSLTKQDVQAVLAYLHKTFGR